VQEILVGILLAFGRELWMTIGHGSLQQVGNDDRRRIGFHRHIGSALTIGRFLLVQVNYRAHIESSRERKRERKRKRKERET
jgi:hypothetical protein